MASPTPCGTSREIASDTFVQLEIFPVDLTLDGDVGADLATTNETGGLMPSVRAMDLGAHYRAPRSPRNPSLVRQLKQEMCCA
jgi:hypothetical protein